MSSNGSSRDTLLGSDFHISSFSSPTVPSSAGEGKYGWRRSALVSVQERGGVTSDLSESDDEQVPSVPASSTAAPRHSRSGSRGRAETRHRDGDKSQSRGKSEGAPPLREASPYTPTKRSTSLRRSARELMAGPQIQERTYGPFPTRVPRLPYQGAEGDHFGTQSLWAAHRQPAGPPRSLGDGASVNGRSDSAGDFSVVSGGQSQNSAPLREVQSASARDHMLVDHAGEHSHDGRGSAGFERETARVRATQVSRHIEVDVRVDILYFLAEEQSTCSICNKNVKRLSIAKQCSSTLSNTWAGIVVGRRSRHGSGIWPRSK